MSSLKEHINLKVFKQHGFIAKSVVGKQVVGFSIFSGKDKLFINPLNKMWDCKNTGINGGYQQFLKEVHKLCLDSMTPKRINWLIKNRGLKRTTIIYHKIGYNPYTECYTIPVWDTTKKNLNDLKIYNTTKKVLYASAGANASLYGLENLVKYKKIWLVEGEWDKMAMYEILKKTERLNTEIAIAVPGANTWKSEWSILFKEKNVNVFYDNDHDKEIKGITRQGAGKKGALKVYKSLNNICSSIKFGHWLDDSKDGYDIRDHLIDVREHELAYKLLEERLQDLPPGDEQEIKEETNVQIIEYTGKRVPINEIYTAYKEYLHIPDTNIIDVMFSSVIANRLEGDPLWMFIVGPPACGKTEFLLSISDALGVHSTSTLTPHALISGANYSGGTDPSLIPLLNNKTLLIKDFTTILDMNQQARDEIFGTFRDAYDGKIEKMFGNGVFRSYKSKFGLIAGVTPVIYLHTEGQTSLGERFLHYPFPLPKNLEDEIAFMRFAKKNIGNEVAMREGLADIGERVLAYDYKPVYEIPEQIQEQLLFLSQYTAIVRGTVARDKFTKEVRARPFREMPTRLCKQYTKCLMGMSMLHDKVIGKREYNIMKDIAIGSIPIDSSDILKSICTKDHERPFEHSEIVNMTGIPSESCRRRLEDLTLLKCFIKKKSSSMKFNYTLKPEIHNLILKGKIYG